MKKPLFAIMALGLVVLGTGSLYAQEPVATVKVPFPFVVNGTALPAGDYAVGPVTQPGNAICITARNGHAAAAAVVDRTDPSNATKASFEFRKFGDTYFLSRIDLPEASGYEIVLTPQAVAQTLAKLQHHEAAPAETGAQR